MMFPPSQISVNVSKEQKQHGRHFHTQKNLSLIPVEQIADTVDKKECFAMRMRHSFLFEIFYYFFTYILIPLLMFFFVYTVIMKCAVPGS